MSKNEELELIDVVIDSTKKKKVIIEDVSDKSISSETVAKKEKDYINNLLIRINKILIEI